MQCVLTYVITGAQRAACWFCRHNYSQRSLKQSTAHAWHSK